MERLSNRKWRELLGRYIFGRKGNSPQNTMSAVSIAAAMIRRGKTTVRYYSSEPPSFY
jgi:hypothetical protein